LLMPKRETIERCLVNQHQETRSGSVT
jgi:hypothetical protein